MTAKQPTHNKLPLVSIWTLVYNTGPFVIESIKSVINQTYPLSRIQHIIIDDFSQDGSDDLVENWIIENNYECTFIKHDKNWGICKTLNQVIGLIKGEYGMGFSDDILVPNAIEKFVNAIENTPKNIGIVFSNMVDIDRFGNVISESFLSKDTIDVIYKEDTFFNKLIYHYFLPAPSVFYKSEVFQKVGKYDESLIYEDYDFHLRLSLIYDYIYINEKLVMYRISDKNFSQKVCNKKENLLYLQYSVLKHINNKELPKKSRDIIGEYIRKNIEKAYNKNYSLLFRYRMYIDFIYKTDEVFFALKIVYKLMVKNTKKTLKKCLHEY